MAHFLFFKSVLDIHIKILKYALSLTVVNLKYIFPELNLKKYIKSRLYTNSTLKVLGFKENQSQRVSRPCMSCFCPAGTVCMGRRADTEGWGGVADSILQDCSDSSHKELGSACTTDLALLDILDTETGNL